MNVLRDLTGQMFGRLTVLNRTPPQKGKATTWVCQCSCGSGKLPKVQMNSLINGLTVSCGCHRIEATKKSNTKHGMRGTPTYRSWMAAKQRCNCQSTRSYPQYGGAGIKFSEKWEEFEQFLADMGERPEGKTLDRIDGNKGYEPGNCRWATPKEQAANRRPRGTVQA